MDILEEKLEKLKDDLYFTDTTNGDESDFVKLVQLKDVSDEVYETLILLHSNYKSSMQNLKYNQMITLTKVIDINIDMLNKIKDKIIHAPQKETSSVFMSSVKSLLGSLYTISIIAGVGVLGVLLLWSLYKISPEASESVYRIVKLFLVK
jgi:hypothetical protein